MRKTVAEEEKLKSFNAFTRLYEKAAPIVRHIANLNTLREGKLPLSPYALVESSISLKMILYTLRKIPEPKDKELSSIQRDLETALSSCIKAAEQTEKYSELGGSSIKGQLLLSTIINSTVLAHEYIESVSKRLEIIAPRMSTLEIAHEIKPASVEIDSKDGMTLDKDIISPGVKPISIIDKTANYIVSGLDKLGDIIIFPIKILVSFYNAVCRYLK